MILARVLPRWLFVSWLILLATSGFTRAEETASADAEAAAAATEESSASEATATDEADEATADDREADSSASNGEEASTVDPPAADPNAGLADLDEAAQLKVTAEERSDLNDVIDKLESAIEKGLDKDNRAFAEELLISTLLQRAQLLGGAILNRPLQLARNDPRWIQVMQVRQFALSDLQRVLALDDKLWEAHLLIGRLQVLPNGDLNAARRSLRIEPYSARRASRIAVVSAISYVSLM